jgi:hypothetical protein
MGRKVAFWSDWLFYPEWLTIEQACYLSSYDTDTMLEIIAVDGVDLRAGDNLIEKRSLWEWTEVAAELAHWQD